MTTGERLVLLRKACRATQAQVAESVGVDLKTIRRYEQDKCSPPLEAIAALARFYHVSADDIVFGFKCETRKRLNIERILLRKPMLACANSSNRVRKPQNRKELQAILKKIKKSRKQREMMWR